VSVLHSVRVHPTERSVRRKGERARICRKCRSLPGEKQEALKHEHEVLGFLEQSRISEKNIARLRTLARSENPRIAELACLMLEVAVVTPHRRRRIRTLARMRHDVLKRMEQAGLIQPLPVGADADPDDLDPVAAWYEWVEYVQVCDWDEE
jgi:hypothetical protein